VSCTGAIDTRVLGEQAVWQTRLSVVAHHEIITTFLGLTYLGLVELLPSSNTVYGIPEHREYERMFIMNRKTRLISSRIAATTMGVALTFGVAAPAFAQTATTATAATAATAAQTDRAAAHAAQIADLAKRLGVTVEKLTQATKDQRKAEVDKAVVAGEITAAEAVTLKAAIDAGTKLGKGLGIGKGLGKGKNDSGTPGVAPVRKSAAERKAAADAAAAEFAARLGVTPAALVTAGKDQAKARVDADLAAGYLTAAQAAAQKAVIDAADGVGGGRGGFDGGFGGGFGGGRGHRGGGGGGGKR
jgi:hypothetical protein